MEILKGKEGTYSALFWGLGGMEREEPQAALKVEPLPCLSKFPDC